MEAGGGVTTGGTAAPARFAPGSAGEHTMTVGAGQTAAAAGNDADVTVFSTPHLLMLIEFTCGRAVGGALGARERLVGTAVTLRHLAPTPVGERVTARATLAEADGARLAFDVTVDNERERIGEARMEFRLIDLDRFRRGIARDRRG